MMLRQLLSIALFSLLLMPSQVGFAQDQPPVCTLPVGEPATELVVAVAPLDGSDPSPEFVETTTAILAARADLLSDGRCAVSPMPDGRISITLSSEREQSFALGVLTTRGLVEVIDPRGEFMEEGVMVPTTFRSGAAATPVATATPALLLYETILTNDDFVEFHLGESSLGLPVIEFSLTPEATARFEVYTSANIGQPLTILIDGRVVSTPVINSTLSDRGLIDGLEAEEAETLIVQLQAGRIDADIELLEINEG